MLAHNKATQLTKGRVDQPLTTQVGNRSSQSPLMEATKQIAQQVKASNFSVRSIPVNK